MNEYWDADFYEIYMYGGEKWILVEGYYYDNGVENGYGTSREELYSGFYVLLKDFLSDDFDYDIFQEQLTHYVDELEESEAVRRMNEEHKGYKCLPYDELTMDTPCGFYIDYKGEN